MCYHFSYRLTVTLNLIYFKITWALSTFLEHMHKTFEINWTNIKGGCQLGRKVVTHDSKSDLSLVYNNANVTYFNVGESVNVGTVWGERKLTLLIYTYLLKEMHIFRFRFPLEKLEISTQKMLKFHWKIVYVQLVNCLNSNGKYVEVPLENCLSTW